MILPFRRENAETLFLWQADKKYRGYFREINRYLTIDECCNYPSVTGSEVFVYYANELNDGEELKMAGLLMLTPLPSDVYEMGFMIDAKYEGQGEALKMTNELQDYLVNVRGARKIIGKVLANNSDLRRICKLNGFKEVGTFTKHVLYDGDYVDVVLIEKILRR